MGLRLGMGADLRFSVIDKSSVSSTVRWCGERRRAMKELQARGARVLHVAYLFALVDGRTPFGSVIANDFCNIATSVTPIYLGLSSVGRLVAVHF
jgi:hypothetical protein